MAVKSPSLVSSSASTTMHVCATMQSTAPRMVIPLRHQLPQGEIHRLALRPRATQLHRLLDEAFVQNDVRPAHRLSLRGYT